MHTDRGNDGTSHAYLKIGIKRRRIVQQTNVGHVDERHGSGRQGGEKRPEPKRLSRAKKKKQPPALFFLAQRRDARECHCKQPKEKRGSATRPRVAVRAD